MERRPALTDAQKAEWSTFLRGLNSIDPNAFRAEFKLTEGGDLEQGVAIVNLVEKFEPKNLTAHPYFQYAWGAALGETVWQGIIMARPGGMPVVGDLPEDFSAIELNPVRTMALEFNRAIIDTYEYVKDPDGIHSPDLRLHMMSVDHMLFDPRTLEAYPDLSYQKGLLGRLIEHAKDKPVLRNHYQLVLEKLDDPGYVESNIPDQYGFVSRPAFGAKGEDVCPELAPISKDERALLEKEYGISMTELRFVRSLGDLIFPFYGRIKFKQSSDDWRVRAKDLEKYLLNT